MTKLRLWFKNLFVPTIMVTVKRANGTIELHEAKQIDLGFGSWSIQFKKPVQFSAGDTYQTSFSIVNYF